MNRRYPLHRFRWIVLLSFIYFAGFSQSHLPVHLDQWIESARQDWKIPGMAVGIVKDGEVVFEKGFGEKRLGFGEPVDEHTIFSIASVSKNMTAAALAILVDREKIHWDDKIIDHIPWFRFKDPWVTQEATIRDALTHRTGLGRILGNRLHFMTNRTRDEVLYQMRYMDFEKPFRSAFVYNNVMYSLAGQVIEYVDGRTWDQFMKEELFEPLRMHSATTSITKIKETDNVAFPHQEIDGEVIAIPRRNWDNASPAAGVNASVHDLNKWLLMQLDVSGQYEGKTLISTSQMNEIRKPQMIRGQSDALAPQATYGMGWTITDHHGKRILTHGGATDGFNTVMYLVPELNLGIIVVGNTFNSLGNAIAYQVIDHYLGVTGTDWNERYLNNHNNLYRRASAARTAIHDARIPDTRPTLNLNDYTGSYRSKGYGHIEIRRENDKLIMRFWEDENLEAELEHWHYDTFRAIWKNRAQREEFMQFHIGKESQPASLEFEFVLRPMLLQVGAYPSHYTHTETFIKQ